MKGIIVTLIKLIGLKMPLVHDYDYQIQLVF